MTDTQALLTELLAIAEADAATAKRGMETTSVRESAWEAGNYATSATWVLRLKRRLAEIGPEF